LGLPFGFGQDNNKTVDCSLKACPPSVKVSCGDLLDPSFTGNPVLNGDDCDKTELTHSDALAGGICSEVITITRTWTLTDEDGKATSCTQKIEIVDETAPSIVDVPDFSITGCEAEWP